MSIDIWPSPRKFKGRGCFYCTTMLQFFNSLILILIILHWSVIPWWNQSCKTCKLVWMPSSVWNLIKSRPRFVPLLMFANLGDQKVEHYMEYNMAKEGMITTSLDCPSYKLPMKPSGKAVKLDKTVQAKNKFKFHAKSLCSFVLCNWCGRWHCIFAPSGRGNYSGLANLLDDIILSEPYDYQHRDALFGLPENPIPHPVELDMLHVEQALTCSMPMEKNYFTAHANFTHVCSINGNENDLLGMSILT